MRTACTRHPVKLWPGLGRVSDENKVLVRGARISGGIEGGSWRRVRERQRSSDSVFGAKWAPARHGHLCDHGVWVELLLDGPADEFAASPDPTKAVPPAPAEPAGSAEAEPPLRSGRVVLVASGSVGGQPVFCRLKGRMSAVVETRLYSMPRGLSAEAIRFLSTSERRSAYTVE